LFHSPHCGMHQLFQAAALRRSGRRAKRAGEQKAGQGQCGNISFSQHLIPRFSFRASRGYQQ